VNKEELIHIKNALENLNLCVSEIIRRLERLEKAIEELDGKITK